MIPSIPEPSRSSVFDVLGHNIRFGVTEGDVVYAVASDFAKTMGHRDAEKATRLLAEDEKGTQIVGTPGGPQSMNVIYEDGLWELIFRSSLPGAQAIKKRVKEILRQIRQTGSYSVVPALPDITTPAGVLAMAEQFALTARQLVDADRKIAELEPKALAHDTFLSAHDGDVLVRQAAKVLGLKEKQLRQFLADEHLLYRRKATCGADQWDFYADHARHFHAVEQTVEHTWGTCAHYTVYVRPAGLALIQKRIAKRKAEMDEAIKNSP
ncbi:phage antirepressor [Streptodolium elevatio]|uniref:Phage antirepressor KilAC domain-containing protein n=1 Tax=Streptodolium elevatio TaxID=3157996 RepID=A0ABV3DK21_9ACTN